MFSLIVLCRDQEMTRNTDVCKWSGKWVFVTGHKNKKYSIFGTNNWSKIMTYTLLNTASEECNLNGEILVDLYTVSLKKFYEALQIKLL